jgi:hypothetical protein
MCGFIQIYLLIIHARFSVFLTGYLLFFHPRLYPILLLTKTTPLSRIDPPSKPF